ETHGKGSLSLQTLPGLLVPRASSQLPPRARLRFFPIVSLARRQVGLLRPDQALEPIAQRLKGTFASLGVALIAATFWGKPGHLRSPPGPAIGSVGPSRPRRGPRGLTSLPIRPGNLVSRFTFCRDGSSVRVVGPRTGPHFGGTHV